MVYVSNNFRGIFSFFSPNVLHWYSTLFFVFFTASSYSDSNTDFAAVAFWLIFVGFFFNFHTFFCFFFKIYSQFITHFDTYLTFIRRFLFDFAIFHYSYMYK